MFVETGIRLTDSAPAWGLVRMVAEDGSVEREYIISGEAVEAVNNGKRECPPGCTLEQWRTGRVGMFGHPLEPGLAFVDGEGALVVNFGVRRTGIRVKVDAMLVPPRQWKHSDNGSVFLAAHLVKLLDVGYQAVVPEVVS